MLRECSPPQTCHVSCVMCHMSRVMCHMSQVTCHMSFFYFYFFFGQSGEAYWWRVCYQRGLPRLVLFIDCMENRKSGHKSLTDPVEPGLFFKQPRHSLTESVRKPFPPDLHNIINHKR